MKVLLIAATAVVAASLAGFSQSTAGAAPPVAVSIRIHPNPAEHFQRGTWEAYDASGAIDDSGTYEGIFGQTAPPDRNPFTPGPIREHFLLSSVRGSLTIRAEERILENGQTGVWEIGAGTGDYADASGHGVVSGFSMDPITHIFTLSLEGVWSKIG